MILPYRRDPRPIVIDGPQRLSMVRAALPPSWTSWKVTAPELAAPLREAQSKYADAATTTVSPLADAVASLAVVWLSLSNGVPVGPGTDTLQPNVGWLVDLWVAEHGPSAGLVRALDALALATGIVQTFDTLGPYRYGNPPSRDPARWRRLREHVAAASEADYGIVRAHAEHMRANAAPMVRLLTSYVFPWEAAWASADTTLDGDRTALVGTVLDAEACAEILRSWEAYGTYADGRLETMAEILGPRSVVPLGAMLTSRRQNLELPARLLARHATPETAEVMAKVLGGPARAVAKAFFFEHPDLALVALCRTKAARPTVASAVARDHEGACAFAARADEKTKRLLEDLGARPTWVEADAELPKLDAASRKWPGVSAWLARGAPWSERGVLAEVNDPRALDRIVHAAAREALPIAFAAVDALAARADAPKWVGRVAAAALPSEVTDYAGSRLVELQRKLALTDDDVDDMIVPSFASDSLDFGGRRFEARVDGDLRPVLLDARGERLASLPRATNADDKALAKKAAESWDRFRDDAAQEPIAQAQRMQAAMESQRLFTDAIFRETVLGNPVLCLLARRLLWQDARGLRFRVTDDGAFADRADQPTTVVAPFRIVHPGDLREEERAHWAELFASYEILQPFAQLGARG